MPKDYMLFTQVELIDRPTPSHGAFVVLHYKPDGTCPSVQVTNPQRQPIELRPGDLFSHKRRTRRFVRTRQWEFPETTYPWFDTARACLDAVLLKDKPSEN